AAVGAARDQLEHSADPAEHVRDLRQLLICELAAEDDAMTGDAAQRLDAETAPESWTQQDWYAGIEVEALRLARSDSARVASRSAFRRVEKLARTGGDDDTRAGSTLCGIALGLSTLGFDDPARRIYAAAGARFRSDEQAAFRAACTLDRVAYSTGTWALRTP